MSLSRLNILSTYSRSSRWCDMNSFLLLKDFDNFNFWNMLSGALYEASYETSFASVLCDFTCRENESNKTKSGKKLRTRLHWLKWLDFCFLKLCSIFDGQFKSQWKSSFKNTFPEKICSKLTFVLKTPPLRSRLYRYIRTKK